MRRPVVILGVLAVVAAAVVGVLQSGGTEHHGGPGLSAAAFARETRTKLAGAPAPRAAVHHQSNTLPPGKGFDARLRALRGHPVVVNVWGAWCTPCRAELPVFQAASLKLGRSVAFLGLDTRDPPEDAASFLRKVPVAYPSYQDLDGSRARRYGLLGTPSTIFYDRAGRQRLHQGAYDTVAELEQDIRRYAGA